MGDVLIHAGDATSDGTLPETEAFLEWFCAQPHETKIYVPGNHDPAFAFARIRRFLEKKYPAVRVLIDQALWLHGIRIYGAPWLSALMTEQEHFWIGATSALLKEKWNAIPDNTGILVTHGPPFRMLDKNESGQYVGDPVLADRLKGLSALRLHIFGHVHSSHGIRKKDNVLSVNAAMCSSDYHLANTPVVIDWNNGAP